MSTKTQTSEKTSECLSFGSITSHRDIPIRRAAKVDREDVEAKSKRKRRSHRRKPSKKTVVRTLIVLLLIILLLPTLVISCSVVAASANSDTEPESQRGVVTIGTDDVGYIEGAAEPICAWLQENSEMSDAGISAVLGHMDIESGLNASLSTEGTFGLLGWDSSLELELSETASRLGLDESSTEAQLIWFVDDLKTNHAPEYETLCASSDVKACACALHDAYGHESDILLASKANKATEYLAELASYDTQVIATDEAIPDEADGLAAKVVKAAYSTPATDEGYCAAWVDNVFRAAGVGSWNDKSGASMYEDWCTSSDLDDLKPGMIVAVSSCAGGGTTIYGHVGIYVGDGLVRDCNGECRTTELDTWIDSFGSAEHPIKWGWLGGKSLA